MSPSLLTIVIVVLFGLCLVITFLSLTRFSAKDLKTKIIGIMFFVKCFGILQFIIPPSFYSYLYTTQEKIASFSFDFIFISILYAVVFGDQYYKLFALYVLMIVPLSVVSVFSDLYFFRDSFLVIVGSTLLSVYSLLYFYRLLNETPKRPLEKNPMFWISTGVLTYNVGFIFLMILVSIFTETSLIKELKELLHHTLKITSYSIILIGILVDWHEKK